MAIILSGPDRYGDSFGAEITVDPEPRALRRYAVG
jgi:hypothetical protein